MEKLKALRYERMSTPGRKNKRNPDSIAVSTPAWAQHPSENVTFGAGVAIFHVKTSRVVVCFHSRDEYYFLPKGRRDVNETSEQGAEREGYEESGYRNRLLPISIRHQQPRPQTSKGTYQPQLSTEPVWTMLMPQSTHTQYILYWYVAETLPPEIEAQMNTEVPQSPDVESSSTLVGSQAYRYPPKASRVTTLRDRITNEPDGYEPPRHENTGVDEEEMLYKSQLVGVETAIDLLGTHTVMADVVRRGWAGIQQRILEETMGPSRPGSDWQ